MPIPLLALLALLLQPRTVYSSPPAGDTVGYWQQRVRYRIEATLDEGSEVLHSVGEMVYVNNSPDTLREMYVHQYLNAFRPGSQWSRDDAREGRVRYQAMTEPHYAYERFTEPPTVDGVAVRPEYPGAPDSTVARFALPRPLAPRDSVRVHFAWDARPSTLPRRQGRRGRHYDFAQWYPKVAVYDRAGWQHNALRPAGEFYGEFGTYDVTMVVRDDQVIGSTGVPVAGDPGWSRVRQWGEVNLSRDAYGPTDTVTQPPAEGHRRVRFLARDVHHFGWSTSPDYRYEGGMYEGRVAIHVLYRPGDEPQWGNGQAALRTARALQWLESLYGPYLYPQVTNLHRLDGGGTEFPMLMMNGSASQGLILHELGHIFTYGILGNNEWRAGWMDEGLTSYQTAWAQGMTAPERAASRAPPEPRPGGYRGHAVVPRAHELGQLDQLRLDLVGRSEPIGSAAHEFSEFGVYNSMIYTRAERMYGALRDAMGDSAFVRFLAVYYDRWKLKHVDEMAMRRAAEDASGQDLGWFFRQWVHEIGLLDYALHDVSTRFVGNAWVTSARIAKAGDYWHPMPVGARTASGWTIARGRPTLSDQWVEIRTAERPLEVRLDPLQVTEDWDRRNDAQRGLLPGDGAKLVFDWPFLEQVAADRAVVAAAPFGWYSERGGVMLGVRLRSNYRGLISRSESGLAVSTRAPRQTWRSLQVRELTSVGERIQFWSTTENPRLPGAKRPLVGVGVGLWALDGIAKVDLRKRWDDSPFIFARGPEVSRTLSLTGTFPHGDEWFDPSRWSGQNAVDLTLDYERRWPATEGTTLRALFRFGGAGDSFADAVRAPTARVSLEAKRGFVRNENGRAIDYVRAFAGWGHEPIERAIGVSSRSATETFASHFYRPWGAPLTRRGVNYVPLGDAGMRGYSPMLRTNLITAVNLESAYALFDPRSRPRVQLWWSVFADGALVPGQAIADAGIGVALESRVFDRDVRVRADVPLFVSEPFQTIDPRQRDSGRFAFRWSFSFNDLWR